MNENLKNELVENTNDAVNVENAVDSLSDEMLASLAKANELADKDFADMTDEEFKAVLNSLPNSTQLGFAKYLSQKIRAVAAFKKRQKTKAVNRKKNRAARKSRQINKVAKRAK